MIGLIVGAVVICGVAVALLLAFGPLRQATIAPVADARSNPPLNSNHLGGLASGNAGNVPPSATTAGPKANWNVTANPPMTMLDWPVQPPAFNDLQGELDQVLLPATPSFFFAVQSRRPNQSARVFNLLAGKASGEFTSPYNGFGGRRIALHPEGKFAAITPQVPKEGLVTVDLWDTQAVSSIKTLTITQNGQSIDRIDFCSQHEVLAVHTDKSGDRFVHLLTVLNIETGERVKQIPLLGSVQKGIVSLSPGGRYIAVYHDSPIKIAVYDLLEGIGVGQITNEDLEPGAVEGLQFSPDGTQLAVLVTSKNNWSIVEFESATGRRKPPIHFQSEIENIVRTFLFSQTPRLQWVPDASAFLVAGALLVDRTSGEVLWTLKGLNTELSGMWNQRMKWATPHGIWCLEGKKDQGGIVLIPSPWKLARETFAKISDEANLLRPGTPVEVVVDVGDVSHVQKEVAAASLLNALRKYLQSKNLQVTDRAASGDQNQPANSSLSNGSAKPNQGPEPKVVLRVLYTESAEPLADKIRKQNNPFPRQGKISVVSPTGDYMGSMNAMLRLSLTNNTGDVDYWTSVVDMNPAKLKSTDSNPSFQKLLDSVGALRIPSYLTADPKDPQFPLVHYVTNW